MAANEDVPRIQKRMKELEDKLSHPLDEMEMEKVLAEYGESQAEFERLGGYELESSAAEILTGLGIGPADYLRPTGELQRWLEDADCAGPSVDVEPRCAADG